MKRIIAVFVAVVLVVSMVGCNPKTEITCDYDINFVEYTDEADFSDIEEDKVPLIYFERDFSDNVPYTREKVLASDSLVEIKFNRKPKEVALREHWLKEYGCDFKGPFRQWSTTGSYAIDGKKVLVPVVNRYDYMLSSIWYDEIYKGFEMVVTFKDDTVEKYAFVIKAEKYRRRE